MKNIIKGCWQLSAGHKLAQNRNSNAIDDLFAFTNAGVTTFDCADIYTGVEELLGVFRKKYAEQNGAEELAKLRFHTKFVPDLDILPNISKQYIEKIIDRSLLRLGMETLDLVQFHWWDFEISGFVDAALILTELQNAGKIKHIGVTNFDVLHLKDLLQAGVRIDSNQIQYSLIDSRPENGMTTFCQLNNIKLLCYGVVAGGFLSDHWLNKSEPIDDLENRSLVKYRLMIDEIGGWEMFQSLLLELSQIAQEYDATISEIAMSIILSQPVVSSVITGASSSHIDSLRKATQISLAKMDISNIKNVLPKISNEDIYSFERNKNGKHASIMKYNLNHNA